MRGALRAIACRLQGMSTASLLQLGDKDEHTRVRAHLNAFFTQENVESVYRTLRDAVVERARAVAENAQAAAANAGSTKGVPIDAFAFAFELINEVVMKVRAGVTACITSQQRVNTSVTHVQCSCTRCMKLACTDRVAHSTTAASG